MIPYHGTTSTDLKPERHFHITVSPGKFNHFGNIMLFESYPSLFGSLPIKILFAYNGIVLLNNYR